MRIEIDHENDGIHFCTRRTHEGCCDIDVHTIYTGAAFDPMAESVSAFIERTHAARTFIVDEMNDEWTDRFDAACAAHVAKALRSVLTCWED